MLIIKLRAYRVNKGYSQEFMADKLGISQRHYGRMENGETPISLRKLSDICEILSARIEDIIHQVSPAKIA